MVYVALTTQRWKVIQSGVPTQRAKHEHGDARVLRDPGEEHIAEKLGVHECQGRAWQVHKGECEPDWESR